MNLYNYNILALVVIAQCWIIFIILETVTVRFPEFHFAETHFTEAVSPNGRFPEQKFHRTDTSPNG